MSLPNFIDALQAGSRALTAVCVLALAGCALPGLQPGENGARGDAAEDDVPAEALTLYEQAAAFMAAGDYVEAELRFKEFLLRYPTTATRPGTHLTRH